jgi:hypothetical protein
MPNLTYIGQTPSEGTGSPVIILRHLRRLAGHGWKITVIGEAGDDTTACDHAGWPVEYLPLRRRWWPPFRPDSHFSRKVRTWLLGRECLRLTADARPDALLGYLAAHADFSPEIAAHFARQSGAPLSLLIHDDAAAFAQTPVERAKLHTRHAWILRQTHRCWFVSPELAATYNIAPAQRRVLLPIPEGWTGNAVWQPAYAQQPRVYYAGFIWAPQFTLLTKLAQKLQSAGARLVLLSRETPELRTFLNTGLADWLPPFASNRDALAHLAANAAGVIISYAETNAEMPWVATSFPSKFVEYSHLGLPAAIISPDDSSIGRWAMAASYPFFYTPDQLDAFTEWARGLRDADSWRELAQPAGKLAATTFNPEQIHRQFEDALLR